MKKAYLIFKKEFPNVKENEPLYSHTTFNVGGPADIFLEIENPQFLLKSITLARELKIPFIILGKGSNVLVSDKGFEGLVIKNQCSRFKIRNEEIWAESGVNLSFLIQKAAERGVGGLSPLFGFPSTLGGAIYGNAGKAKFSIANVLKEAKILTKKNKIKTVKKDYFNFSYRFSKLKETKEIVLEAIIKGKKENKQKIALDIKKEIERRGRKMPSYPSAGSIFKNPPGFFAGELIEKAGFSGEKIGGAKIWEGHCNIIINWNRAKSEDIKELIEFVKEKIFQKYRIKLEEEIQYIGQF